MGIGRILWYASVSILAILIATVMAFFAIAFVLSWSYQLFGVFGPVAVILVGWMIAFFIKQPL